MDINELRRKVTYYLNDEVNADNNYIALSVEAEHLGLTNVAVILANMAGEEAGHADKLRRILSIDLATSGEIKLSGDLIEVPIKRPFPETFDEWGNLGDDIKKADPDLAIAVNERVSAIFCETDVDTAKRWLTEQAGRLGIT